MTVNCKSPRELRIEELAAQVRRLSAENARLRALLEDAASEIADWGSYAEPYFQDKHGLADTVARFRLVAFGIDEAMKNG